MEYRISSRHVSIGLRLIGSIAFAELLIMMGFTLLRVEEWMHPLVINVTDALVLGIVASVMIYYWVVRPMKTVEEYKQVEKELRESELKFKRLFETSQDGIMLIDPVTGRVLDVNPSVISMLGYDSVDYIGLEFRKTGPFRGEDTGGKAFAELSLKGCARFDDLPLLTADGRSLAVELIGNSYRVDGQDVIQCSLRDVTARKKSEEDLIEWAHQAMLGAEIGAALVKSMDLRGLLQPCAESIVGHLDAAFARIWTFNEEDDALELQASAGMYTHIDGAHSRLKLGRYKIGIIAQERKPCLTNSVIGDPQIVDQEWARREGIAAFAGYPLVVADRLVGVIGVFSRKPLYKTSLKAIASVADEIALGIEHKKKEDRIQFLAYYDGLTGLPNRNFFKELLKRAIEFSRRHRKIFGVIYIDLDDFKRINDTLGHDSGDRLLQAVSARLLGSVRSSDHAARLIGEKTEGVARMGGDEFVILLQGLAGAKDASHVARRILHELSEPYSLDGHEAFITSSIGISIYPYDGEDADTLFKNADTAMYHAKDKGKNDYQYYTSDMNAAALEILKMEAGLHRALDKNELLIYYQPKMDLVTKKTVGMEALVRWRHPESGLLPPARFISLAEATGLIMPIGDFVLRAACKQARKWQDAGYKAVSVAVNLSCRQCGQKSLVPEILKALKDTGLAPQYLELEITESAVMKNPEAAIKVMDELKAAGVKIAIDDFGTGYSSLDYLRRFPLDALKIDKSFVGRMFHSPSDAVIVKTIIAMAHNLGLKVIAEGVEDERQMEFLREHGCDVMQGYLLSPPVPAEEFSRFLEDRG